MLLVQVDDNLNVVDYVSSDRTYALNGAEFLRHGVRYTSYLAGGMMPGSVQAAAAYVISWM